MNYCKYKQFAKCIAAFLSPIFPLQLPFKHLNYLSILSSILYIFGIYSLLFAMFEMPAFHFWCWFVKLMFTFCDLYNQRKYILVSLFLVYLGLELLIIGQEIYEWWIMNSRILGKLKLRLWSLWIIKWTWQIGDFVWRNVAMWLKWGWKLAVKS